MNHFILNGRLGSFLYRYPTKKLQTPSALCIITTSLINAKASGIVLSRVHYLNRPENSVAPFFTGEVGELTGSQSKTFNVSEEQILIVTVVSRDNRDSQTILTDIEEFLPTVS